MFLRSLIVAAAVLAVLATAGIAAAVSSWVPVARIGLAQRLVDEGGSVRTEVHEDGAWRTAAGADGNPFDGVTLDVDPSSLARRAADAARSTDPARAELFERIADQPQAYWIGDWVATSEVQASVEQRIAGASARGAMPVFALYAIPQRDCGSFSAGGLSGGDAYRAWIREVAAGIGAADAVVVLEPDALAGLDCLDDAGRRERLALLADAVAVLGANPFTAVYIDAGNSAWQPVEVMAKRLTAAGVAGARGFSLNVSNYRATVDEVAYGHRLAAAVGGAHFVVDTSRNGRGPGDTWCNARGRALGAAPTADTNDRRVDAYLWVKRPGESDGECGVGDPPAGQWFPEIAEEQATNAL